MPTVVCPKEFFVKERNMYSSWRFSFWRELFQNSTDAHASKIQVRLYKDADNIIQIEFEDNGTGMTQEVLESVYFRLGSSTKNDGSTVGGFGRARILTCFSMKNYEIHTLDNLVKGDGGSYEIEKTAFCRNGCILRIQMEDERLESLQAELEEYLGCSQLGCNVEVNGKPWKTWSYRRQMTRFLEQGGKTFASVYVNKSANNNRLLVRVNGTVMFSQYIRANAQVIVEIDSSVAREVLNANRDGLHSKYAQVLNSFIEELSVNTTSALKSRFKDKSATIRGRGLIVSLSRKKEKETSTKEEFKSAARTAGASEEQPQMVVQGMGQGSMSNVREGRKSAEFGTIPIAEITGDNLKLDTYNLNGINEYPKGPEVGEKFVRNLPDIFVIDDTENEKVRRVIESYNPEKWVVSEAGGKVFNKGGNLYKLLMLWKIACQHAVESLMASDVNMEQVAWGLGWVFSDTASARHEAVRGGSALLLNPVDIDGSMRFSLRSRRDQKVLMALAKHEVAHTKVSYHDETFANVLTDIDENYDEKEVFRKMSEMLADGISQ